MAWWTDFVMGVTDVTGWWELTSSPSSAPRVMPRVSENQVDRIELLRRFRSSSRALWHAPNFVHDIRWKMKNEKLKKAERAGRFFDRPPREFWVNFTTRAIVEGNDTFIYNCYPTDGVDTALKLKDFGRRERHIFPYLSKVELCEDLDGRKDFIRAKRK